MDKTTPANAMVDDPTRPEWTDDVVVVAPGGPSRSIRKAIDSMPHKRKLAMAKGMARRAHRAMAKEQLRKAETSGYVCPKCFKRYSTAEARAECRAWHNRHPADREAAQEAP